MKTIISKLAIIFALISFNGCKGIDYKKTPGGMPYKLFESSSGKKILNNSYLKISVTQTLEDSVLFTTNGKLPTYFQVNPVPVKYDVSELWTSMKQGDSVFTIQMIDTFMQRSPGNIPPQFKKGDRIMTYIKILDVFETDSAMAADEANERQKWSENEVAYISKYLADKNIKAQKTPKGAFVEIIDPGQGNLIDTGNNVSLKYKGISFSGVTFDTNIDSSFGHTEPLNFDVGSNRMISGLDDAVRLLKKGAIAKIYIPSMLAYGPNPGTDKIKPFEHIMFEVSVTEVQDKVPVKQTPQIQGVKK